MHATEDVSHSMLEHYVLSTSVLSSEEHIPFKYDTDLLERVSVTHIQVELFYVAQGRLQ